MGVITYYYILLTVELADENYPQSAHLFTHMVKIYVCVIHHIMV